MMAFQMPETRDAVTRFAEITGLDLDTAPEIDEVITVLADTGLLAADQPPQPALFDAPAEPDAARTMTLLRLALVGGATYWAHERDSFENLTSEPFPVDAATFVAVVAALLEHHYADITELGFEQALTLLERELPARAVFIADSPSLALTFHLRALGENADSCWDSALRGELGTVVSEACQHDGFALCVFNRLSATHGIGCIPLSYGSWLVYRTAATLEP